MTKWKLSQNCTFILLPDPWLAAPWRKERWLWQTPIFFWSATSASSECESVLEWQKDDFVVKFQVSYSAVNILSRLLSLKEFLA